MRSDKLQDAIGEIRDDLIEDAHAAGQDSQTEKPEESSARKRRKWTGWIAAAAACCVLAVGMKVATVPTGNTGTGSDVQVATEAPDTDTSDTSSASSEEDASAGTSGTDNSRASSGTGAATSSGEDSKTETSAHSSSTAQKKTSETRKVVCNGPYGRISLSLPKGWKYEILKPDSKKLYLVDYGIHFYPKSKKGYVEVGYQKAFGVCGTGLTEKTKTLAGSKASVGYYDGGKVWDFIRFDGKMEGVTAYSYNIKKWSKAQRKKVYEILDTLKYESDVKSGSGFQ